MIVVLVGPHGVGKTTLGERLARRLGAPFDPEIGALLAADALWRPPTTGADRAQPAFDEEVFRREVERDRERGPAPRVVESWHPVNLAYAERRSPEVVASWLPRIEAVVREVPCVVVPLLAPPEVLEARAWETGDPAFFQAVGFASFVWAARLGCRVASPIWTHRSPAEALVEPLARRLEDLWTASS